jgi:crotonobetainyl-CoA:carnitine CoA-transferase CaiB-like acyl-CoA transferase
LHGIRVIDWTMWQLGPVCSLMLADMGAEVIKLESLEGDHGRGFNQVGGVESGIPEGSSAYFEALNRQKLGIAVDLKNPRGKEIVHRLVEKSDVFVENFRQGVPERLGMGYDDVKKHNPNIIYARGTGYGPNGPDSGKPAFALTGEARSGSMWWSGPDDGVPYTSFGIADQIGGIMLACGVLGAVVARERLGFGQLVDCSHLGSMMWLGAIRNSIAMLTGSDLRRQDRTEVPNPLWNWYRCADDRWIAFSMLQGRYWPAFCRALERADLIDDHRFKDPAMRDANRVELIAILDQTFARRTCDEWGKRMDAAGDIIWERVQMPLDLLNDPQATANGYLVEREHAAFGQSRWLQTPLGFEKTPVATEKMAPVHGEDTERVLIDLLGCSWDDIGEYRSAGAIL